MGAAAPSDSDRGGVCLLQAVENSETDLHAPASNNCAPLSTHQSHVPREVCPCPNFSCQGPLWIAASVNSKTDTLLLSPFTHSIVDHHSQQPPQSPNNTYLTMSDEQKKQENPNADQTRGMLETIQKSFTSEGNHTGTVRFFGPAPTVALSSLITHTFRRSSQESLGRYESSFTHHWHRSTIHILTNSHPQVAVGGLGYLAYEEWLKHNDKKPSEETKTEFKQQVKPG